MANIIKIEFCVLVNNLPNLSSFVTIQMLNIKDVENYLIVIIFTFIQMRIQILT